MKFSYNWLRELSGTEKTPAELAELVMFHSFEVESVEPFAHGLESVVIGLVETVVPHPDADRLRVTTVVVAEGEPARTIVCGAPNVAPGQKVAVALPGAKLPGGIEIKDAIIRGVASSGMICAEDELGLGSDHGGILVLSDDAPIGESFAVFAGLADSILDINVLPNRGCDAISYRGLAREIAALEGRRPDFDAETVPVLPASAVSVSVSSDRCRRYLGILFEGVSAGASSLRIRSSLLRSGLRSVSPTVDITNYLMLLFGQPMHAFDADSVSGGIVVRQAGPSERLELLDGTIVALSPEDLVIADAEGALALAGIMGGKRSAVTAETKRVFLEIASFDPSSVRASAVRHRLSTDASYRFERNVDTERVTAASAEAVRLFSSVAAAEAVGCTDTVTRPDTPTEICFSPAVFSDMFGSSIDPSDAKAKLGSLGVDISERGDEWVATVPTFRPDLRDGWNLAEEVGRMIGYDRFPAEAPILPLVAPRVNDSVSFDRNLRNFLASAGWDEVLTYSFYSEADGKRFGEEMFRTHLRLSNPMNPDQALLRASLLPSALRKASENRRYLDRFRFFELGDRYAVGADGVPSEERMLSLCLVPERGEDGFASLKGFLEKLFRFSGLGPVSWEPLPEGDGTGPNAPFHPTRTATISIGTVAVGVAGEISPVVAESYGLHGSVFSAQISFDALRSASGAVPSFRPLPKFPFATRDLSIPVSPDVTVGMLEEVIRTDSPSLREVRAFDSYEKDGKKTLSFHLFFGHDDRTVTGEEVDAALAAILGRVRLRFGQS